MSGLICKLDEDCSECDEQGVDSLFNSVQFMIVFMSDPRNSNVRSNVSEVYFILGSITCLLSSIASLIWEANTTNINCVMEVYF